MELLDKAGILERLSENGEAKLYIQPLLDEKQIGEVSIDLRIGPDFLVSILTRKPYISSVKTDDGYRGVSSFFQKTRREFGDRFVLYPGQVVLGCTLEYVSLPSDVYADIISRSSYTRLGVHINTMIQPGYRGCLPLELFNHGNNPIEIVVGSRICQARLFQIQAGANYRRDGSTRKYLGNVRPVPSRIADDMDIERLNAIAERRTNP
jgi:dCTP deaminase